MADGPQKPEQSGTEAPQSGLDLVAAQKLDDSLRKIDTALNKKENEDSLAALGTEMLYEFSKEKYTPEVFLNSLQEVFYDHEHQFNPPMDFFKYVEAFGPDMVILCQQKLKDAGLYLGKFGPNEDGVDGKLGNVTAAAFNEFYNPEGTEEAATGPALSMEESAAQRAPIRESREQNEAGKETPTYTPKEDRDGVPGLASQLKILYGDQSRLIPTKSLPEYYGKTERETSKYVIAYDPLSENQSVPITFLGQPIKGGFNLEILPFLMLAKSKLKNLDFKLHGPIEGYKHRQMSVDRKPGPDLSGHCFCAFDCDPNENAPAAWDVNAKKREQGLNKANNRGNLPDQVVFTLARCGFLSGLAPTIATPELTDDPMHFQYGLDPNSEEALAILNNDPDPTGRIYWKKCQEILKGRGLA